MDPLPDITPGFHIDPLLILPTLTSRSPLTGFLIPRGGLAPVVAPRAAVAPPVVQAGTAGVTGL